MINPELIMYLALFLEEAKEQVALFEQHIVELERSGDPGPIVQILFRAAHTLKGSSRTMGFERIGELTHSMESALDLMRQGSLSISPAVIDLMLECIDALQRLVNGIIEAGDEPEGEDVRPLMTRLSQLGGLTATESQPVQLVSVEPQTLLGDASGETVVVEVSLVADSQMKGVRATLILRAARELGEVIACDPPEDLLILEAFDTSFSFEMRSNRPTSELEASLGSLPDVLKVDARRGCTAVGKAATVLCPPNAAPDNSREPIEVAPEPISVIQPTSPLPASPAQVSPPTPTSNAASIPLSLSSGETVRVDVERLDKLLNLVGELITDRHRLTALATSLQASHKSEPEIGHLLETAERLARITGELQQEVMLSRMLPVEGVFQRMPRMVRDLARQSDKEVELFIDGGETELDRSVLELIGDPIIHLIRNAVDHGIDTLDARKAAGKPVAGQVWLRARHEEGQILIEVEDDGRGIDPDRLKDSAVAKGMLSKSEAAILNPRDALNLIFIPGFSTAEQVSSVSGRGVGMDIVSSNLDRIGGTIQIDSELGRGTRFTMSLPLTLAILRVVLVEASGSTYAIAVSSVREIVNCSGESADVSLSTVGGQSVLLLRGNVYPLRDLGHILTKGASEGSSRPPFAMIVRSGESETAIAIDGLRGEQEVVIKPLGPLFRDVAGATGACVLSDGSVAVILDPVRATGVGRQRVA